MSELPSAAFQQDLLAREPFSQSLERFLCTEHHFVDGSLVLSLSAPFGSGKTTFLHMWAKDLASRRSANAELPRPVIINAWESDYCGDPLLAIVSALTRALSDAQAPEPEPGKAAKIREALRDLACFGLGLANAVVANATGVDAIAIGEFAADQKDKRNQDLSDRRDALDAFEAKTSALVKLKEALKSAFGSPEPKAIVLIDELDRCRPDYAISYLETIKHIFDVHGIVFVLAIDEGQLRSAASVLFGQSLDFAEYYRKFSHRSIPLPEPEKPEIEKLTKAYCERYLQAESKRKHVMELGHSAVENIGLLFHSMRLRPRQIQEAFRVMGHCLSTSPEKNLRVNWAFGATVLFMAGLRSHRKNTYDDLAEGRLSVQQLSALLEPLSENSHNHEWWFKVLAAGLWNDKKNWESEVLQEMSRLGWVTISGTEKPNMRGMFAEFLQGWGDLNTRSRKNGINRVHERIERLMDFAR